MRQNLISAQLSDADTAAAKDLIDQARAKTPFLLNLTEKERHDLPKMGQDSVAFVNLAKQGLTDYPQHIPDDFPDDEFDKDTHSSGNLWQLRLKTASYLEGIDDTLMAMGSDAMKGSNEIYGHLKVAAKNNATIKLLVDEMAKRYKKSKK